MLSTSYGQRIVSLRRSDSGALVGTPSVNTHSCSVSDVALKASVPHWRYRISTGSNATGTYSRTWIDDALVFGKYSGHVQGLVGVDCIQSVIGVCLVNPRPIPPTPPANDLDSWARMLFLHKVRQRRTLFQGGTFLGELAEALRMIRRPAEALRRSVSTYSAAAKKAARSARTPSAKTKAVTGTWLEYSYGWRPLLGDVDDAMKALASKGNRDIQVVKAPVGLEFTSGIVSATEVTNTSIGLQFRYRNRTSMRVTYLGGVGFGITNLGGDWRSDWGFSLDNFVPTVYNLIPYSFLVDYFSNIGSVVDGASLGTIALDWGCVSTSTKGVAELIDYKVVNSSGPVNEPYFSAGAKSATLIWPLLSRGSFQRTNLTSVSVGLSDISFSVPGVGDWRKWANIAALAAERIL